MIEKIKVLSAIFTKSSCPLIWGLWPAFVAPVPCETLPLARTLSASDPEGRPPSAVLCAGPVNWHPSGLQSSRQGLSDSLDSGHLHKSSLSNKSAGIPDIC